MIHKLLSAELKFTNICSALLVLIIQSKRKSSPINQNDSHLIDNFIKHGQLSRQEAQDKRDHLILLNHLFLFERLKSKEALRNSHFPSIVSQDNLGTNKTSLNHLVTVGRSLNFLIEKIEVQQVLLTFRAVSILLLCKCT